MGTDKNGKKSIISKTLCRCRSLGGSPKGCFSVYVGPQRERFVVRTEWVNHPLFRALLDEAEMEYGFHKEGPLELPCDVGVFRRVLVEMSRDDGGSPPRFGFAQSPLRSFGRSWSGYKLVSPA